LARKIPDLKFARVDSDSMRTFRDLRIDFVAVCARGITGDSGDADDRQGFGLSECDAGGGDQRGHVAVAAGLRASERTFQLITQVAGRAGKRGRGWAGGGADILPDDPTIRMALKQDYPAFAAAELASRRRWVCRRLRECADHHAASGEGGIA